MKDLNCSQIAYGGAYQYSVWSDAPDIWSFYTNKTVIGWYLDNVEAIVTRVNSFTGVAYRDDPAIFGWDLINEPHVLGDDSGDILTVPLPNPFTLFSACTFLNL